MGRITFTSQMVTDSALGRLSYPQDSMLFLCWHITPALQVRCATNCARSACT